MKRIYKNAKICRGGLCFNGALAEENGFICGVYSAEETLPEGEVRDLNGAYLTPVFVDTHIHGFGGFGTDGAGAEDMLLMSEKLAEAGVGAFLPTIYPNTPEFMLNNVKVMASAIGKEKGAKIIGLHLEGPFISPDKLGVMKPEAAAKPSLDLMKKLYDAAEGKISALTLAPELDGIDEIIDFCLKHKIIPQAGHTNASYEQMLRACDLGLRHATHLFNAMRGLGHREAGAAGAVILTEKFSFELIADGFHVCPKIVEMVLRLKKPEDFILVTDALSPAGTRGGLANGEEVVLSGGVFRRKSDNVVAGSALTMLQGIKNLASWGYDVGQAVLAACENPARLYNLDFGVLKSGARAYFNIIDKDFNLLGTIK